MNCTRSNPLSAIQLPGLKATPSVVSCCKILCNWKEMWDPRRSFMPSDQLHLRATPTMGSDSIGQGSCFGPLFPRLLPSGEERYSVPLCPLKSGHQKQSRAGVWSKDSHPNTSKQSPANTCTHCAKWVRWGSERSVTTKADDRNRQAALQLCKWPFYGLLPPIKCWENFLVTLL